MTDSKARLLEAAGDYVAANGVGDLSLRRLATAIGTSHRMLIYHFGSKEGLLVEVIRAMERRERAAVVALHLDGERTPGDLIRRCWQRLSDPAQWPHERLFFELYGQALQGYPGTGPLLESVVDAWLEPLVESGVRRGLPPELARSNGRLILAVTRGLLLDLLATGDRDGVDLAMERFIAGYEAAGAPTR
ncbi:TetR/AcrR family transcriptional regulator [Solihabitans fulvus]|uniref:TetR/AcrR family transcriptional regulator n=1 Tax=Solihabitans fulvus TaxID=1892852 RepID=A0A5B2WSS2_9PSEU|nr:TetR/AcrR family transcriptional regulator [Solihabitans fulvus]KAA2253880.1 TetR/AcrR family transcriptional regulator [Solihabitans fulvus]